MTLPKFLAVRLLRLLHRMGANVRLCGYKGPPTFYCHDAGVLDRVQGLRAIFEQIAATYPALRIFESTWMPTDGYMLLTRTTAASSPLDADQLVRALDDLRKLSRPQGTLL